MTGLGVIAPNANGVADFELALRKGHSGVRHHEGMADAGLVCQVAGMPDGVDALAEASFSELDLRAMNAGQRYAALAALEAWRAAGLAVPEPDDDRVDWDSGAILGTGIGGMDTIVERVVPLVASRKARRLGSTAVEQVMASGISARVSGLLGLGNQVTTNSSACATGVEALWMGAERIRAGQAERMLCGGAEGGGEYIWAGFDAMRVLCRNRNDEPARASRPMSASAGGFVPGCGAGAIVLESLESAVERGVPILAEVAGGAVNCGGHRGGGSMTAPNPEGVRRCITDALRCAGIDAAEVDVISGHLTATGADPKEVAAWADALGRGPGSLPAITSTKSLVGHTLGAAGAIECVASVLMLRGGFVHASINCEDVHPEIAAHAGSIAHETRALEARVLMKAGFGFGDVNAALAFRRMDDLV